MTDAEKKEAMERLKLLTDEADAGGGEGGAQGCCGQCEGMNAEAGGERFFTDAELGAILALHEYDVREAAYDVLLRKAQSTDIRLAGGTQLADQRAYWLSRARAVRPNRGRAGARADGT